MDIREASVNAMAVDLVISHFFVSILFLVSIVSCLSLGCLCFVSCGNGRTAMDLVEMNLAEMGFVGMHVAEINFATFAGILDRRVYIPQGNH